MFKAKPFMSLTALGFLGLVACGGPPASSLGAPLAPRPADAACVEGVRAYLRVLKLNEKELAAGFTIPFLTYVFEGSSGSQGAARATGRLGPGGHQIYQVSHSSENGIIVPDAYVEIAPE
jgi:hypothetical protein